MNRMALQRLRNFPQIKICREHDWTWMDWIDLKCLNSANMSSVLMVKIRTWFMLIRKCSLICFIETRLLGYHIGLSCPAENQCAISCYLTLWLLRPLSFRVTLFLKNILFFGHASWATLAQSISSFKNKTDVFTAAQNAEIVNSQRVSLSEEIFMKSKNKYVFKSLR